MGKADAVTKEYLKDPAVFADACNFFFGEGKVQAENLTEISETELAVPLTDGNSTDPIQKFRDVMNRYANIMEDGRAVYIMLGGENQSAIHYAMPVRIMVYDSVRYQAQITEIVKQHKVSGDYKRRTHDEYLSGLLPEDKLIPVITFVIYYGNKPWDGPRSLHDMLSIPDQDFLPWIENYKINIIEPAALSDDDLLKFKSSLREVLTIAKYAEDKDKMRQVLHSNKKFQRIDPLARKVIETVTGEQLKGEERKDGTFDMCKAFEDMKMEGRTEAANELIISMHENGLDDEMIAKIAKVTVEYVKKVLGAPVVA